MNTTPTQFPVATSGKARSALFYTSASMIALLVAAPASAQQVINDGDNTPVTSLADGDTITADTGVTSIVAGAPVVTIANNDVTVENAGTLATSGVTQTIQVNQGTTGATITNAATGRLEGDRVKRRRCRRRRCCHRSRRWRRFARWFDHQRRHH